MTHPARIPQLVWLAVFVASLGWTWTADAQEKSWTYFAINGSAIQRDNSLGASISEPLPNNVWYQVETTPQVVVSAGAEAFVAAPDAPGNNGEPFRVIGRRPAGHSVDGFLVFLRRTEADSQQSVAIKYPFQISADTAEPNLEEQFHRAKATLYSRYWSPEVAGSAIFRHLAIEASQEIGIEPRAIGPSWPLRSNFGDVSQTMNLMSGGRAISESLQLRRELEVGGEDTEETVPIDKLQGINIRDVNWDALLEDTPVELDPLAEFLPTDQYALFIPSFTALEQLIDGGDDLWRPLAQLIEPQSRATDALSFYQSQLGLQLNTATRFVGRQMISEIAITGSDPYYRTGTDLAVLMLSPQPLALRTLLEAQFTTHSKQYDDAVQTTEQHGEMTVSHWSTPDRRLDIRLCQLGNAIVVTNSAYQVSVLHDATSGKIEKLSSLKEYKFFRQRYARRADDPAALLVITDASIRKFCGPRWRIAASRRTRARATIADMTVSSLDAIVSGTITSPTELIAPLNYYPAGKLSLTAQGVVSETYGTLRFQTPVAEMPLTAVTRQEADIYGQWRTGYLRRWRGTFDPIAVQARVDDRGRLELDVSVIPLIFENDYRFLRTIMDDTRLSDGPDPEVANSMAGFLTMSFTRQGQFQSILQSILNSSNGNDDNWIDYLSWIDNRITLLWYDDPAWETRVREIPSWSFDMEDSSVELPFGIHIPSNNPLKLTAFMVAVRTAIDSFAANMFQWEQGSYREMKYTIGNVMDFPAAAQGEERPRLYYLTTPRGLTIATNEHIIHMTIDAYLSHDDVPAVAPQLQSPPSDPSVHDIKPQIAIQFNGKTLDQLSLLMSQRGWKRMASLSWNNVPILNYLRARFPDREPKKVYEQLFYERLLEPVDGQYVWNEEVGTYASNAYGTPLLPMAGPRRPVVLNDDQTVGMTFSFQDDGLRATFVLEPSK